MNTSTIEGVVNMAGNPFGPGFTSTPQKHSTCVIPSLFSPLIDLYNVVLQESARMSYDRVNKNYFGQRHGFKVLKDNVLSPAQINTFAQLTQPYDNHPKYREVTGIFLTDLIQTSHRTNHSNFYLDVRSLKPLDALCHKFKANRTFHLKVIGELGSFFAERSTGGKFSLDRVGFYCGIGSTQGSFYIQEARKRCGEGSSRAHFYVQKADKMCCFFARDSMSFIGEVEDCNHLLFGENNHFYTPSQILFDELQEKGSEFNHDYSLLTSKQWQQIWNREAKIFARCKP